MMSRDATVRRSYPDISIARASGGDLVTSGHAASHAHERELRALLHEQVVLVDRNDREMGVASKLEAHRDGRLHRAVSVLVYDSHGSLLLQRRSVTKYHSAGLWSNSCCGHPRPGEDPCAAAQRRLREELGLACVLQHRFSFIYEADLEGSMHEHELDHVFVGYSDATPIPDPAEVGGWCRMPMEELRSAMAVDPDSFTVWFHVLMNQSSAAPTSQTAPISSARGSCP